MSTFISPKNSLVTDIKFIEIKKKIVLKISETLQPLESYKSDAEYLSYIVNLIEHYVKPQYKISKIELCIAIFQEIFPQLTSDEIDVIRRHIEFLHKNTLIVKLSTFQIVASKIYTYLKKRL